MADNLPLRVVFGRFELASLPSVRRTYVDFSEIILEADTFRIVVGSIAESVRIAERVLSRFPN